MIRFLLCALRLSMAAVAASGLQAGRLQETEAQLRNRAGKASS